MDEITIRRARLMLDNIEKLQKLKVTITDKYNNLWPKAKTKEIEEVFTLIVQSGFSGLLYPVIYDIEKKIDEEIEKIVENFKSL